MTDDSDLTGTRSYTVSRYHICAELKSSMTKCLQCDKSWGLREGNAKCGPSWHSSQAMKCVYSKWSFLFLFVRYSHPSIQHLQEPSICLALKQVSERHQLRVSLMFEKTDVQIDKYFVVMAMPELNWSYSYGHTICSDEFWEDNKEEVTYTC